MIHNHYSIYLNPSSVTQLLYWPFQLKLLILHPLNHTHTHTHTHACVQTFVSIWIWSFFSFVTFLFSFSHSTIEFCVLFIRCVIQFTKVTSLNGSEEFMRSRNTAHNDFSVVVHVAVEHFSYFHTPLPRPLWWVLFSTQQRWVINDFALHWFLTSEQIVYSALCILGWSVIF